MAQLNLRRPAPLARRGAPRVAHDPFARNVEILRRHLVDGLGATKVAELFGVSRQTVYNVARAYDTDGLAGLVPGKSGPRAAFKCTAEVVDFVLRCKRRDPNINLRELVDRVADAFGLELHPNTIRYALAKRAATEVARRQRL